MFFRLLLLLTLIPLVELSILLRIAERIRWGPTVLLVVATGVLGAWLARREGIRALQKIQSELAAGTPPTGAMLDAALIVVAGVVLVTPGVLTDALGFALLIPPARSWIKKRLVDYFHSRIVVVDQNQRAPFKGQEPFVRRESVTRQQPSVGHEPFIDVEGHGVDADEQRDHPA